MRLHRRAGLALAATLTGAILGAPGPALAAAPFSLGFNEPVFTYSSPADQDVLASRMAGVNAKRVRIVVKWDEAAGGAVPPTHAQASDPGWPGYYWVGTDTAVQAAQRAGLDPLLVVEEAPKWAEGPHRPSKAVPGVWKPSPTALAQFMATLATRYSGSYVPAGASAPLPAVHAYQVWNEPNLDGQLLPQFTRSHGRVTVASADMYRTMLRLSYQAIKRVSPADQVIAAGIAPFGDFPLGKGPRSDPIDFTKRLLCLTGSVASCHQHRVQFDAFALNIYPAHPTGKSRVTGDVSFGDIPAVRANLASAARKGFAGRIGASGLWVTEFSWSTSKPDFSFVVSPATQARYYVEALRELTQLGITTAFWWRLVDGEHGVLGYQNTSGFYTQGDSVADDVAKPIVQAAQLPFLVERHGKGLLAWGLPPQPGPATVEREDNGAWTAAGTLGAGANVPATLALSAPAGTVFRLTQGTLTSPPWTAP